MQAILRTQFDEEPVFPTGTNGDRFDRGDFHGNGETGRDSNFQRDDSQSVISRAAATI
jgi:hypothetical protein